MVWMCHKVFFANICIKILELNYIIELLNLGTELSNLSLLFYWASSLGEQSTTKQKDWITFKSGNISFHWF